MSDSEPELKAKMNGNDSQIIEIIAGKEQKVGDEEQLLKSKRKNVQLD